MFLVLSFLFIPVLFIPFAVLLFVLNNYILISVADISSFQLLIFNALLLIFPLSIWFTSLALENKLVNNLNCNKNSISFTPLILCFVLANFFLDNNFITFTGKILNVVEYTSVTGLNSFLLAYIIKLVKTISSVLIIFYFLQFIFEFVFVFKVMNKPLHYKDFKVFISVFIFSILADFLVNMFLKV